MSLTVEIEDAAWNVLPGLEDLATAAVRLALEGRGPRGDVYVLFTSDAEIRGMNRDWRGKDQATNVLSFPATQDMPLPQGEMPPLGDVVLAYETVAGEASSQGKRVTDHVTHLIIHGMLHLLGYDHETEDEAELMESEERALLARLGVSDPYTS